MTLTKSFFLLTIAFFSIVTALVAIAVALSLPEARNSALVVAGLAGVIAALILRVEARRDPDPVLTQLCAVSSITATAVGMYWIFGLEPGIAPKVATGLAAILAIAFAVAIYRRRKTESLDFPNILARMVNYKGIFETEGVQFTGYLEPGVAGKPHFVSILLQNCFDSARDVTIAFDPAGSAKYLRFYPKHTVRLPDGAVSRVTFPVVTPTYPGAYQLYFSIAVSGRAGRRVRLWRAQEATNRIKPAAQVALLAVGHLAWGGGVRFNPHRQRRRSFGSRPQMPSFTP